MPQCEWLQHTFQHSWKDISIASWMKYPNPERPDVEAIDLLKKSFDPQTGILYTTRLVTIRSSIPSWILKITGTTARNYFLEDSIIDPKNNQMILSSRNIRYNKLIELGEVCTYTQHPQNPAWTQFIQEAKVAAFSYGVARQTEQYCVNAFRQNAAKGREIMEQAIRKIKQEAEGSLVAVEGMTGRIKHEAEESFDKLGGIVNNTLDNTSTNKAVS